MAEVAPLAPSRAVAPASLKQVFIAGAGFFADAYDLFVIDLVLMILHAIQPLRPEDKSWVAAATLVGATVGQIGFGLAGDFLGRKQAFVWTCVLIIGGALLSSMVQWQWGAFSLVAQLTLCRFLLGIGVGGEYPLSATITSENSPSASQRGRLLATVFSMQGWGMLTSCLVVLFLLYVGVSLEMTWRLALGLGALPSLLVVSFRAQMEETHLFQEARRRGGGDGFAQHCLHSWSIVKRYWQPLFGTAMTWFLLDITFYGSGSFKTRIGRVMLGQENQAPTRDTLIAQTLFATLCVGMAIPGYLLSIAFIDKTGRRKLQLGGFLMMSILFFLLGGLNSVLSARYDWVLVLLFGLTFLFSNFGPNTTTFVLPVEIYPTAIRATCHGISAAAGKLGAAVGAAAFAPLEASYGLDSVLIVGGVVALLGAFVTYFFTFDQECDLASLDEKVAADMKESQA